MVHTRFSSSSGSPSYSKNSPQNIKKDNKKRPLSGQAKGKKTTKQKKAKLTNADHIIPSPQVYFQFHCCNILILVFFFMFYCCVFMQHVCFCNMQHIDIFCFFLYFSINRRFLYLLFKRQFLVFLS